MTCWMPVQSGNHPANGSSMDTSVYGGYWEDLSAKGYINATGVEDCICCVNTNFNNWYTLVSKGWILESPPVRNVITRKLYTRLAKLKR